MPLDDDIFTALAKKSLGIKPAPQNDDITPLLDRMQGGTFEQESGGNYQVRPNARTGAVGGFQVLPSNIPSWTKTYVGRAMTPQEFERDSSAQDKVFRGEMGRYLKRAKARGVDDDTAIRMAAAQWYGGEDDIDSYDNAKRFRPNEPSFREYTTSVLKRSTPKTENPFTSLAKQAVTNPVQPTEQEDVFTSLAKSALTAKSPQQPVTELIETIQAQIASAADPKVKTRYGVLTTDVAQDQVFGNTDGFAMFATPQGNLWVNVEKAKKQLKLKSPKEIGDFIAKNPNALTRILGIAENVGDQTSDKPAVTARDPQTDLELASAAVTTPDKVVEQTKSYAEQFPGATIETTTTDDVAQRRSTPEFAEEAIDPNAMPAEYPASTVPPIQPDSDLGRALRPTTTQPTVAKAPATPQFNEQAFNEANSYLASTGQQPLTREQFIATQKGTGQVDVSATVNEPTVQPTPQQPARTPQQPQQPATDRKFADSSISFFYESDDPTSEERQRTVEALTSELNVSPEIVNQFLDRNGFDINETPTERAEQRAARIRQTRKIPASVKQQIVAINEEQNKRNAKAQATYDQYVSELQPDEPSSLAAIRTRFDLGLMSPDEFLAAVEREKELARQIANETGSYQQLGPNKDENHRELAQLEKQKASKEAIEAILKDYGSLDAYTKEKERLDKEYAYRPLARPIEFAKNLYGAVPKAAASLLKSADVVLNLNPLKMGYDQLAGRGIKLDETALSQVGDGINKYLESVKNKDLKDDKFVTVFADTLGQVGTQIAAGALTGGATLPTLIGASMGAAGQLDEAKKFNATDEQKIIAAFVGAAAAIPDALLFSKMTGGNATKLVLDFGKSILARAGVRFGDAVAKKAAREAVEALAVRILQNSTFEGVQEVSENKINDWLALNTYDKSESRRAKLFSFTDDDKWSFIGGILGGGVSGVVEARLEKMNGDQRSQMMADIQNELAKMHSDKAITTPQFEKANGSLKQYFAKDANIQADIAQPKDETKVPSQPAPLEKETLVSDTVDKGEDVVEPEAVEPTPDVVEKPQNIDIKEKRVDTVTTSRKEKAKKLFPEKVAVGDDVVETENDTIADVPESNPNQLPLIKHKQFETGKPVTFNFIRNTEPSPRDVNNTFAQNEEPAGKYMIERDAVVTEIPKGWEGGTKTFQNPLVIKFGEGLYNDADNWKQVLATKFNATGKKLSKKLLDLGYDGIVTVNNGDTAEIIDLTIIGQPKAKATAKTTESPQTQAEPTKANTVEKEPVINPSVEADLTSKDTATRVRARKAVKEAAEKEAIAKANETVRSAKAIAVPRSAAKKYSYADEVADQINTPEFKELEAKSATETPSMRTGFTKTQTEYLANALQEYVYGELDKQGFGSADQSGAKPTLAARKDDPMPLSVVGRTGITSDAIAVPDDGIIRVPDVAAANRLHQKITGKPIEGIEKAKNVTIPSVAGVIKRPSVTKPSAKELANIEAEQSVFEDAVNRGESAESFAFDSEYDTYGLEPATLKSFREDAQKATTKDLTNLFTEIERSTDHRKYGKQRVIESELRKRNEWDDDKFEQIRQDVARQKERERDEYRLSYLRKQANTGDALDAQRDKEIAELEARLAGTPLRSTPNRNDIVTDRGIDYDRAKDVAERVRKGSLEIKRLDPSGEQGRIAGGARAIEASVILGSDEARRQASSSRGGAAMESRADTQSRQEKLLENYAKREGIWYDWNKYFRDKHFTRGGEAFVYRQSPTSVVKTIDYRQIDKGLTPLGFLDNRIALFNTIFPGTPYTLKGFTKDENGKFRFLVEQQFIDGYGVSKADVDAYMDGKGFEPLAREAYTNGIYSVFDLHEKNVTRDEQNNVYVIDAVPRLVDESRIQPFEVEQPLKSVPNKLLAPNGKPSNLNERQWNEVRTPEFIRFFGDWINNPENASKVVDENGEPLAVYHGTKATFDKFRVAYNDIGIHFGTTGQANDRLAFTQQDESGQNVVAVYLNIRNPIRLTDVGWFDWHNVPDALEATGLFSKQDLLALNGWDAQALRIQDEYNEENDIDPDDVENYDFEQSYDYKELQKAFGETVRNLLKSSGYDGVVYKNEGETAGGTELTNESRRLLRELQSKYGVTNSFSKEIQATPEYKAWVEARQKADDFRKANAEDSWITLRPNQIKSAIGNRGTFDPNEDSILKKLRTVEDVDDLERLSKTEDFREVVPMVKSSVKSDANGANILSLDTNEAAELARTAIALAYDRERADESIIEGFFATPKQVENIRDAVVDIRDAAKEAGVDTKPIDDLLKNLDKASKENGTVRFEVFEDARGHETVHQASYLGAIDKELNSRYADDGLADDPVFQKFHKKLDEIQGKSSSAVAREEALAYLSSGEYARFGLTESEAVEIVAKIVESYAKKNGVESLKTFEGTQVYEAVENYRRQSEVSETSDAGRSGVSSGREARPDTAKREPAKDDTGERGEKRGQEKLRSLPGTLREAGVDAVDEAYNVFGNQDAIEAANNLIADLGMEKAIKMLEASTTYDKTHAVMSFMLQRALRNEAIVAEQNGDIAYAQELRDRGLSLASRHAELATQAGQFTQAAAMVADAVESVIYHAEKIAQKRGRPLTPVEYEQFEKLGIKVEDQSTDLTKLRKDIRNLKAQIKRLKDSKPHVVGTRVNRKAIAKAKASLPDMTALIQQIKESLRESDGVLRMVSAGNEQNFAKWFGDSKAIDAKGNPLRVYRGDVEAKDGIFFTSSTDTAEGYTRSTFFRGGKAPQTTAVYLSLQNPLVIDALGKRNDNIPVPWKEWKPKAFGNLPDTAVSVEDAYAYALENGHDGLIVKNVVDTADPTERAKPSDVYAVKEQSQIKSAIGNSGEYSKDNSDILRSTPDTARERLITYGAAMMLDKPLSEINREQFADDMRKTFGSKVEDMLPQLFAESFNLRQELLTKAKNELATESLKAEFPDKSDAEIKRELKDRENERKERRDKGTLAKKLAQMYDPVMSRQKQDVLDAVNDIADPIVADYAEKIITNEVRPIPRSDRKLYGEAMTAIRDAHKILRDEELVRKQTIVGSTKALRDLEREEFLKRNDKRNTDTEIARAYRRLDENPVKFYGKELLKLLGESRSILASGDLSGSLRQGFYHSVTNPLLNMKGSENIPSSYGTMIKAIWNKGEFADRMKAIENHPDFDIMKQMGVEFAEAGGGVAEENIRTEYLKAVPIVKNWLNVSERTYSGFLDTQRALWAESVINELQSQNISFRDKPEVYKAAGALINIATGRGNIGRGKTKAAIEAFGGVFFAPRFVVSRAQLLGHVMGGMATLPAGLRAIEAKRAARFHTAISLPMLALIAAGIVAVDPDDDDFLKIRVGDKARYELTGGLQQYIKLIAQLGMTVKNVVTEEQTLKAGAKTAANKGYYFGVKKLAPVPSYINAALTGKEPDTTEFNWLSGIGKRLVPITIREVGGAAMEDGVDGALLTLPTLFGVGVGYYPDKMKKPGGVDAMLAGPEVKRMTTDDLVQLLKEDYETPEDKKKVENVLKRKAIKARQSGTLTQKEVDNIKKVLPDFNITARDIKKK